MSPEEFQNLLSLLARYGFEAVIAGAVVFLLLKSFLPGYLSEKGKNLATKEDIAKITDEIERVKSQYAVLLEALKAKHQLRLAAIDRRLEAHQEAFTLWRELLAHTHTEEVGKAVIKCQDWWEKNCLYLEPNVREAFSDAYSAAHTHNALLQGRSNVELVKENWERITKAGQIILEAAQLPGFTTVEKKELADMEKAKNA